MRLTTGPFRIGLAGRVLEPVRSFGRLAASKLLGCPDSLQGPLPALSLSVDNEGTGTPGSGASHVRPGPQGEDL